MAASSQSEDARMPCGWMSGRLVHFLRRLYCTQEPINQSEEHPNRSANKVASSSRIAEIYVKHWLPRQHYYIPASFAPAEYYVNSGNFFVTLCSARNPEVNSTFLGGKHEPAAVFCKIKKKKNTTYERALKKMIFFLHYDFYSFVCFVLLLPFF